MTRRIFSLVYFAAAACGPAARAPETATEVVAAKVAAAPTADPGAASWDGASELIAKLLLQDQAPPKLDKAGVESVRVRALHDGRWIVFRLEWDDPTKDDLVGPARFGDMAAIQVPSEAGSSLPDGAMGQTARPVRISLWRASSDHRLRTGIDPIAALYPNALPDHYPAAAAADTKKAAMEVQYSPARATHNIVAVHRADSPTEDMIAEGFGSLTTAPEQISLGKGDHDGRRWRVVIARPLDLKESEPLRAGARSYIAFAVWQGADGNVGSRKMRSGWVSLSIEGSK
jgi:hypothetical protein